MKKKIEDELLYLIKKSNFAKKISITEFDLLNIDENNNNFNKVNKKRNKNNEKVINQIELVYNKINKDKPKEESRRRRLMHEMLFHSPTDHTRLMQNKNNIIHNTNKKFLPKLFYSEISHSLHRQKINHVSNSRKEIFNNQKFHSNTDCNTSIKKLFSQSNNNSQVKNKKNYYVIQNRNNKKSKLPPINSFRLNYQKLKLDVNNEIDHADQQHEDMMKMYREIEFRNKYRFVV
jgi:hypothetical protein